MISTKITWMCGHTGESTVFDTGETPQDELEIAAFAVREGCQRVKCWVCINRMHALHEAGMLKDDHRGYN